MFALCLQLQVYSTTRIAALHVNSIRTGQPYDDIRFPIDFKTFARPEFDAAQANGDFVVNMNRLPVLICDGVSIGQSKTIERFVAKKLGFSGTNEFEEAQIDMITEHIRDIKQKYADAKAGKTGEEQSAAKATFLANDLPTWFGKLENCLDGSGFAVGRRLSLADVSVFNIVQDFFDDKDASSKAAEAFPKLSSSVAAVSVAAGAWIASRPDTPM